MVTATSVLLVLFTALVSFAIYQFSRYARYRWSISVIDKLPGRRKHWLLGTLYTFPGPNDKGIEYGMRTMRIGNIVRSWYGPFVGSVIVFHPETVKEILRTSEPKPTLFGAYVFGRSWIGDGLLLSAGKKWARNRRLLTPAFHFDILKPYIKVKNDAMTPLLDKFAEHADDPSSPMEVFSNVSLYTFDVILRCSMSYEDNVQQQGESHPYVRAVTEMGTLWAKRVFQPILYFDFLYMLTSRGRQWKRCIDYAHAISEKIITTRMQALATGSAGTDHGRYKDFLDILITARDDDGKGLTFREIRDEVDTFLFEGHDTTASGISWTLYSLAQSPDCQVKCQQEVDEVLQGRDTDELSWEDLNQLKYTTMCVKEAMRLHSPVPFIQRVLTKPLTINGVTLPPGCNFDIPIVCIHQNPLVWNDPTTFDPDRFLPENFDKMDSYAFVPFSAGPRNCIGQHFAMHEMKIAVARIMRRFTVRLDPTCEILKRPMLVMRAKNGIRMYVTSRNVDKTN